MNHPQVYEKPSGVSHQRAWVLIPFVNHVSSHIPIEVTIIQCHSDHAMSHLSVYPGICIDIQLSSFLLYYKNPVYCNICISWTCHVFWRFLWFCDFFFWPLSDLIVFLQTTLMVLNKRIKFWKEPLYSFIFIKEAASFLWLLQVYLNPF